MATTWTEFGAYLRDCRKESGLTIDQVSSATRFSASLIGKCERGQRSCSRDTAEALDELYGRNGALVDQWTRTKARANDPLWSRQATQCEGRASAIQQYHPNYLPGSLQLREYAREVFRHGRPGEDMESVIEARCSRLEALTATLHYVVPESVLKTVVGGPGLMAEQLEHIAKLIDSGRITVQVLPTDTPSLAGMVGAFRLFQFRDRLPMAYAEHASGGVLIDNTAEVARLSLVWGSVSAFAYDPARSAELIKEWAHEYRLAQEQL